MQVLGPQLRVAGQVRDRARHLEDAVVGARAEPHLADRVVHDLEALRVHAAESLQVSAPHRGVRPRAGAAREVYGVEIVPDAVRDAKENAERNGIRNVHFYTGAAEDLVVSGEFAPGVPCPHADVIVVDPPRKGCDAALIRAMLSLAPERIVYVSCDPSTLARDLKLLAQGDGTTAYIPQYVQPVDMFPQTAHVEVVSLLQKMSNTRERTITLDVEMEDYHRIKNRTEVTADATE